MYESFAASDYHAGKSKICNFLVFQSLIMTCFVSFCGIILLTSMCCWLMELHYSDSVRGSQGERDGAQASSINTSEGLLHLHLTPVCPSLCNSSHSLLFLFFLFFLQMWMSVPPTRTDVVPASAAGTLWVRLYASCRSHVQQDTSGGTVFARVRSL